MSEGVGDYGKDCGRGKQARRPTGVNIERLCLAEGGGAGDDGKVTGGGEAKHSGVNI